jgi:hypothetical protein
MLFSILLRMPVQRVTFADENYPAHRLMMRKICCMKYSKLFLSLSVLVAALGLQSCAVIAVVDTVGSVAVGAVGLAADAAIGTVRLTGKAVGAAADAVLPDSEPKK